MNELGLAEALAKLRRTNPRYAESAYLFLLTALHDYLEGLDHPRHITGAELAGAVKDLAIERFGPLARTVLEHWGVHSTGDLGEIVFQLVEQGILIRQATDRREDFEGLFSFQEAFESEYPWGRS